VRFRAVAANCNLTGALGRWTRWTHGRASWRSISGRAPFTGSRRARRDLDWTRLRQVATLLERNRLGSAEQSVRWCSRDQGSCSDASAAQARAMWNHTSVKSAQASAGGRGRVLLGDATADRTATRLASLVRPGSTVQTSEVGRVQRNVNLRLNRRREQDTVLMIQLQRDMMGRGLLLAPRKRALNVGQRENVANFRARQ
jgi:hypothetical protein